MLQRYEPDEGKRQEPTRNWLVPVEDGQWVKYDDVVKEYGKKKWQSMESAPKDGSAIWAWCGEEDGLCMPRCNRLGKWITDAQHPTEVFPLCWMPVDYPEDPKTLPVVGSDL